MTCVGKTCLGQAAFEAPEARVAEPLSGKAVNMNVCSIHSCGL